MKLKVKIKRLNESATIPKYNHASDAGLDLTAVSLNIVDGPEFGYYEYGFGLAIEVPEGYVGLMFPRSSVSDTGMLLSNSVGVVDSGYRGELKARFKYIRNSKHYNVGDRVAQLVIVPYPSIELEHVEELAPSDRGEKGYGSSNV